MKPIRVLMIGASLNQNGGIATLERLLVKHAPEEIKVTHVTSHDEGSIFHRMLVFLSAWLKLIGRCLTGQVDVVHIHVSDGGSIIRKTLVARTAFLFRRPVLMHANGAHFDITYERFPSWMKGWIKRAFQRCDIFAPVTNLWKAYYLRELQLKPERVVLLSNPTELPAEIPDRTEADIISFAFCGRIGERKGAFDLLSAFAKLSAESRSRARLIMAGDGEIEKARALATQLGIMPHVDFLGWVNAERIQSILKDAQAFVLPSYAEGLPLALMEAMGWGLPVITTPVSGIPDVVTHEVNGLLITPGNVDELASALHRYIHDGPTRSRFGHAARETVRPLDIHNLHRRLVELYQIMLNRK